MPERRKTREELRQEAFGDDGPPGPEPDREPDRETGGGPERGHGGRGHAGVAFEALSDEEQAEINDLFVMLHAAGYEKAGSFQVATEGPGRPTVVSLSVVLPSTNDWDPSTTNDADADDGPDDDA